MGCIFCKIHTNEIHSNKLFENDDFFVINDINPKADYHMLVVSNRHIETLTDMNDQQFLGNMLLLAKQMIGKTDASGYRVQINAHEKGGQEIPHLHMHVMGWK